MRVTSIQLEMASAVRVLGGGGSAKQQNVMASRHTKLPHSVIERLRWRKIKRVPADIADAVREALERHTEEELARARHELFIAQRANEVMAARLAAVDPDYYGPEIARLRGQALGTGNHADTASGE